MHFPDLTSRTVQDSEFDEPVRLTDRALAHARRFGTSALPEALEGMSIGISGGDTEFRTRLDRALVESRVVDLERIEQIYRKHFLGKTLSSGLDTISHELDSGLSDAISLLRQGLDRSEHAIDSLPLAQNSVSRLSQESEAQRAVVELVGLARAHASQTESLNSELTRVRAQMHELEAELATLRDSAYLDHLTQIANRRHMDEVLERELAIAQATKEPLSFVLADLDLFKRLNDTHGHAVGDAVLKYVAALIKRNVKGQDTAARFGGEEFAIICPKTWLFNAGQLADNIRRQLDGTHGMPAQDSEPTWQITASFGVTQQRPADNVADLIERADTLLYRAKQLGRNRVETGP